MKIGLSLKSVDAMIKNLNDVGFVVEHNFKADLVEHGKEIRDKAKEILENRSQQETGKKYWTGKLQESINLYIGGEISYGYETGTSFKPETRESLSISVGPDMRVAPYAEWVEIGHYKSTSKDWWEGYHYLEGAYAEVAPKMSDNITKTVKIALTKFERTANQRTRHGKTKQFTKGFAGMRGVGAY